MNCQISTSLHLITKMNLDPRHLFFKITDSGSGLKAYQASVDGEFILLEFGKNKEVFFCDLTETPVQRTGKERTLKVSAVDNRDNRREFVTKIKY